MASGSATQRNSQLRVNSSGPRYRTSQYSSKPPTPNCNSFVGRDSAVARESSMTTLWPEKSTTSGPLLAELNRLKEVLRMTEVRLSGLPQVQCVVGGLKNCLDYLQINQQNCDEYEKNICVLINLIPLLWQPFIESKPLNVPRVILEIVATIESQMGGIKDRKGYTWTSGADSNKFVLDCFSNVREKLGELQTEISAWGEKREQWMDARLKDLLPTYEAYYNAALSTTVTKRVGCTENTRANLLDDTQAWTREKDGAKIFWLNGMAGTGKTTIAYTMCKWLQDDKRLAASFFCSRNSLECRDVNKIVPTIAYQLGQRGRYPDSYRHRLCTAFEEDVDVARRDIRTQFENLIAKPLSTMGEAMPDNVVVVMDALDECTDVHGAEVVLNMLLRHAENLPLKFFVTSRPEPTIIQRMTAGEGAMRSIIWLHDIEQSLVQADIRTYLADALQSIQVTPSELDLLAERSGCLFIFAATAVRYILPSRGSVNHRQRLQAVLNLRPRQGNKSHKDIDELYITILSNALDEDAFEEGELITRRRVLWTVACASGPLTMSAIAGLLDLPDIATVDVALQPLQSVLRISESVGVVSTLHASFPDFLLSKERAGQFYRSEMLQNANLAERCFQIMGQSLQFNICRLDSAYMLDQEVPDLQDRVDRVISNELFYACRYWGDHLAKCPSSRRLMNLLDSFMQHHFLFWIEVLNLKKHAGHGDGVLGQAMAWLLLDETSTNLSDFIHDARNFVVTFASSPTSLSTPHLYISTLAFIPKHSLVWTTYGPSMRGLVRFESSSPAASGKSALVIWDIGEAVHIIARSSDGKRIASGSSSKYLLQRDPLANVNIWDASSGNRILGPLKGHQGRILSLAFSPDGTRIASGSADRTICIWDGSHGRLVLGPLHGHSGSINSLAFSCDGACLASGSGDHTIQMWDPYSGAQLGGPLDGHQDSVMSVVFSPDGKYFASGSWDRSVRVWDLRTRILIRELSDRHTQPMNSIAYSPDGLRLVSGSEHGTVEIWDVPSGRSRPLASPFRVHTVAVLSVAFSPNGHLVVSGSGDGAIRVWKAKSGILVAELSGAHHNNVNSVTFTIDSARILSSSGDGTIRVWDAGHRVPGTTTRYPGHTSGVVSLSLSPDGTRAASGSWDHTIRIWAMRNGAPVAGPFTGHTSWVHSVAFSPDGARIVSGSADCTLRTWDASTGVLLAGPFVGHLNWVVAVAFSPDGNRIASGSHDGTIQIWDSFTGEPSTKPLEGHTLAVASIAFSPDGVRLVSASWDGTVRLWLVSDNSLLLWRSVAHRDWVTCVAFSPDGTRIVSGSWNRTILMLDACTGAALCGPFTGHTDWVSSVAFSPDGMHVASGSGDRTVRVWDSHSGTMVAGPLAGHTGDVKSVAFTPDGARLISGSTDGTIRFWDISALIETDAASTSTLSMGRDGWLTDSNLRRLLWVPLDLRNEFTLRCLFNRLTIGVEYCIFVDNLTLCLGDQWHQCYCPTLAPA